jgi:hypothetical protein
LALTDGAIHGDRAGSLAVRHVDRRAPRVAVISGSCAPRVSGRLEERQRRFDGLQAGWFAPPQFVVATSEIVGIYRSTGSTRRGSLGQISPSIGHDGGRKLIERA